MVTKILLDRKCVLFPVDARLVSLALQKVHPFVNQNMNWSVTLLHFRPRTSFRCFHALYTNQGNSCFICAISYFEGLEPEGRKWYFTNFTGERSLYSGEPLGFPLLKYASTYTRRIDTSTRSD